MFCCHEKAQKSWRRNKIAHLHQHPLVTQFHTDMSLPGVGGRGRSPLTTLHFITLRYSALHYTTLHYTTLHYVTLHYIIITLHCATATTAATTTATLHYIELNALYTLQLQLHYFTLHYTRLHCTIPHYSTQHYSTSTLHYTILITPHHNYNCNYTNYTTSQLHLHYTTATTVLRHTTSRSCGEVAAATIATTPKKHSSNHLSVHQWICSAIRDSQQPTSPIGFLIFETSSTAMCDTTVLVVNLGRLSNGFKIIQTWLCFKSMGPRTNHPNGACLKTLDVALDCATDCFET